MSHELVEKRRRYIRGMDFEPMIHQHVSKSLLAQKQEMDPSKTFLFDPLSKKFKYKHCVCDLSQLFQGRRGS